MREKDSPTQDENENEVDNNSQHQNNTTTSTLRKSAIPPEFLKKAAPPISIRRLTLFEWSHSMRAGSYLTIHVIIGTLFLLSPFGSFFGNLHDRKELETQFFRLAVRYFLQRQLSLLLQSGHRKKDIS